MDTAQEPLVAQIVEILANGLRRDVEMNSQIIDEHAAVFFGHFQNFSVSGRQEHGMQLSFSFFCALYENENGDKSINEKTKLAYFTGFERVAGL
jgi:hypothetical protein